MAKSSKNSKAGAAGNAAAPPVTEAGPSATQATPAAAEAAGTSHASDKTLGIHDMLKGSGVQPDPVDLGSGKSMRLADLVEAAWRGSDISVSDWNALADADREALILKGLGILKDAASMPAAAKQMASTPSPGGTRMRAVLVVKAKQDSRWRAGRNFGRMPVELNAADLTDAEIAAIEGDPVLITSREERPEAPPPAEQ
ncbi:MAG: hypothetical protein WDM94_09265 [Bauldia sp.]